MLYTILVYRVCMCVCVCVCVRIQVHVYVHVGVDISKMHDDIKNLIRE